MNDEPCQNCQGCEHCNEEPRDPGKRKLLGWMVGIINVALGTAIFGPVLGFMGAPLREARTKSWVPVLDEHELGPTDVQEVNFTLRVKDGYMIANRKYTVYMKREGTEIVCFDPSCTHLGCRVRYKTEKGRFMCPCHGGVFDGEGNVVSGPPPKPLVRHPAKVENGKIWIFREA